MKASGRFMRDSFPAYPEIPVEQEIRSATVGFPSSCIPSARSRPAIRAAKIGIKTADDQLLLYQQAALKDVSSAFYDVLLCQGIKRPGPSEPGTKKPSSGRGPEKISGRYGYRL